MYIDKRSIKPKTDICCCFSVVFKCCFLSVIDYHMVKFLLLALTDVTSLEDIGDSVEQQQHRRYIKTMKHELSLLLGRPLASQAIYSKYPTKTGRLVTPEQSRMIQA